MRRIFLSSSSGGGLSIISEAAGDPRVFVNSALSFICENFDGLRLVCEELIVRVREFSFVEEEDMSQEVKWGRNGQRCVV